jgi:hypothetical protein
MKNAFTILIGCLLLTWQLGLGMVLQPLPIAPAECEHCQCGGKASCCADSDSSDMPLPALPQRQASFNLQPVVTDGQSRAVFKLPQVVLEFYSLPQPLQMRVASVSVHKQICRYLT